MNPLDEQRAWHKAESERRRIDREQESRRATNRHYETLLFIAAIAAAVLIGRIVASLAIFAIRNFAA